MKGKHLSTSKNIRTDYGSHSEINESDDQRFSCVYQQAINHLTARKSKQQCRPLFYFGNEKFSDMYSAFCFLFFVNELQPERLQNEYEESFKFWNFIVFALNLKLNRLHMHTAANIWCTVKPV